MRLSELKTGEKGVIVKVLGHGGFRKRIVEMGFIKGKTVEVMIWFTGLSGSGKSTIAIALERELHKRGLLCRILDGDNILSLIHI